MKAVILAGGLGTRLRPLTFSIPKPLLPVGEKPILQIIIEQLKESEIEEITLATGYHAELIRAFCGDGSKFGLKISYVHEGKPLGTAGPLSLLRSCFGDNEFFILMNGDIVTKLDFDPLIQFSKKGDFDLTVCYTQYVYCSPFGVLSIEGDRVTGIVEKPATEYSISAGIYVVKSTVLEFVPDETFLPFRNLCKSCY